MHYCWILMGLAAGWWGRSWWTARKRRRTVVACGDGDAPADTKNVLSSVRAGIARQYRDIESTIEQIESLLHEAGTADGTGELAHKLLDSQKALSTYLVDSYDTLRKCDLPETTPAVRKDDDGEALQRFLKERLATRERYRNPCSVAMFFIDAETSQCQTLEMFQQLIRVTDRAFLINHQEYVVVLPETDLTGAQVFAARCVSSVTEMIGAQTFAGVTAARDGDGVRHVLNRVDTALYRAKSDEEQFVFAHDGERIEPYVPSLPGCDSA